jgi:hypothetical protein
MPEDMAKTSIFIKLSGTGNQQSASKKAPLGAKDTVLLGGERTSDAEEAAITRKRPHHAQKQTEGGEQKRKKIGSHRF